MVLINTSHISPNFNDRPVGCCIQHLILHYTEHDLERSFHYLIHSQFPNRVSAHYLIDIDGTIYQLVQEDKRAWHAGSTSAWDGMMDINNTSIGIEIVNEGHSKEFLPPYPVVQLKAIIDLCQDIIKRHYILPHNVLGHSDIKPMEKKDPGEHFPWSLLAENHIGLWPETTEEVSPFTLTDYQEKLKAYGYACPITHELDFTTQYIIKAFQRHFSPSCIDGQVHMSDYNKLLTLIDLKQKHKTTHFLLHQINR